MTIPLLAFYIDDSIASLSTTPTPFTWGWGALTVTISNDAPTGGENIYFSFTGPTPHGGIHPGEKVTLTNLNITELWVWGDSPGAYRLSAYSF